MLPARNHLYCPQPIYQPKERNPRRNWKMKKLNPTGMSDQPPACEVAQPQLAHAMLCINYENVPALSRKIIRKRQLSLRVNAAWAPGLASRAWLGLSSDVCPSGGRPLQGAGCTLIRCGSALWYGDLWQQGPFSLDLPPTWWFLLTPLKATPRPCHPGAPGGQKCVPPSQSFAWGISSAHCCGYVAGEMKRGEQGSAL